MRVFLNGRFVEESEAAISFDDRGFLFGDAVYEVIHLYDGVPYRLGAHLDRLERSLDGVMLPAVDRGLLTRIIENLAAHEGQEVPDAMIYIEISRGASPRSHQFPDPAVPPTILVWCRPAPSWPDDRYAKGISVITLSDDRWAKCWIKTVNLLPNVLAKEKARRAGADDALFVRDGMVLESTASNLFIVTGNTLRTAPVTNYILPGVTRASLVELAPTVGLEVKEEPFSVETLKAADEVFLSATGLEVLPITVVDGVRLRDGRGPAALKLRAVLREDVRREVAAARGDGGHIG
ncbi:MAG: aminotransferase class IV [Clostridia bacterium]